MIHADKRWARRRATWVTPEHVFRKDQYAVDVIRDDATAKSFVEAHHYSGSFPAARLNVGLFGPGAELVGVAVFSQPMTQKVITHWLGVEPQAGVELGRFVCAPSVRFNGESWFLAQCWPLLMREKGVTGVLSYADPLERHNRAGELMKRQHWGTIYQASNALHAGRSKARTLYLAPDGTIISERGLSKIRAKARDEVHAKCRGWEYVVAQLESYGAPRRALHEPLDTWLDRVLQGFERVKHPGNLAYVFGLTRDMKRKLQELHDGGKPYPHRSN